MQFRTISIGADSSQASVALCWVSELAVAMMPSDGKVSVASTESLASLLTASV